MQVVVRKDVYEQMTSKLEKSRIEENNGNLGKISAISDDNSKLQSSKNIFTCGDFDDWKISDEELKECEIDNAELFHETLINRFKELEKGNHEGCVLKDYFVNGHHQRHWVKIGTDEIVSDDYKEHEFTPSETRKIHYLAKVTKELLKPYVGTYFHNKNVPGINDFKSPFSVNSIKKLTSDKATNKSVVNGFSIEEHFEAAQNIKEIFENSDYVGTFSDDKNEENVIDMKRFQKKINLSSGKKCYAYVTIKNTVQQKDKMYSIELILKKYPSPLVGDGVHQGITKSNASNNCIIQNNNYLSIKPLIKSLTYSGHKLQGRTILYGMNISIENKKGSYRSGTDKDGHKWRTLMHFDYGYIRGTEGTDGDFVDCYVGPDKAAKKVYIIHQNDPVTHKYDEDKCMLCFESAEAAKKAYMKQYDRPGFFGSMETMDIEQFKSFVFSKQGSRIHKSFYLSVTDITENNKQKKIEQVEKALNALYTQTPFYIKHIPADDSKKYSNLILRITDFDKDKISKAVRSMSFTLDTPLNAAKGEVFIYKAQEELTNKSVNEITDKTKLVYNYLINYFGLPEIRVVTKSDLKYKGKVIYNPETGKPISKAEWERFIKDFEKFLNKQYAGTGKKIVLSAQSLGIILNRLSKNNSLEKIRKMPLSDMSFKGRKLDWISESVKNMTDTFGESLSRERQARVELAYQSAAQRVTAVTDRMRNDMQQIIIDGIMNKESKSKVSQNLFDKCVGLNRDFQRIADTEIQNNINDAYIQEEIHNTPEGKKIYMRRFECNDDNTCKKCRDIRNMLVLVSETPLGSEEIKDEYADYAIWQGKQGGKIPYDTVHPYCRGCWVRYYPEADHYKVKQ